MEENPTLNQFLFNIIYQAASPNKPDILETPSLIAVLALTCVIGVINYAGSYPHAHSRSSDPAEAHMTGSGTAGDLLQNLLQTASAKKGGGDLSPQNMMLLMNLISSLGQKKREEPESGELSRDSAY